MVKFNSGRIKHNKTLVDGIKFHSKMEAKYYEYISGELEQGNIKAFEMQVPYVLQEGYIVFEGRVIFDSEKDFGKIQRKHKLKKITSIVYKCDFKVTHNDGTIEVIDIKGFSTTDFEIKKRLLLCKYASEIDKFSVLQEQKGEWKDYYEIKKEMRAKKKQKAKNSAK